MFRIAKEYSFSAAHQLDYLPEHHQCHRLHGHNYIAVVELESTWLAGGMVLDYGLLDCTVQRWINENWDHRNLNEVICDHPTTAEMLAVRLYEEVKRLLAEVRGQEDITKACDWRLVAVRIHETPRTFAEYRDTTVQVDR